MDLLQIQLSLLFSTALLFLVLLVVKGCGSKHQKHNARLPLPPGPRKLPLIGDLHRLVGLPHHALRNLSRKYGPLMFLKLGEVPAVVVSSPKMACAVMKTHDLVFADRGSLLVCNYMNFYDGIAFGRYGDCWRQLKKISIVELLSAKRVQSYWPLREQVVNQLVDELSSLAAAGTSVNLSAMILSLTNDITSLSAFGKIYKENKKFLPLLEEVIDLTGGFYIADFFPSFTFLPWATGIRKRLEKLRANMDKILDKIIDDHRVSRMRNVKKVEDLVDVLLRVQEDNELEFPLGNNHIKNVIMELFMAGSETSATTIIWAFAEMMKNPRVMEKAQGEVRRVFKGKTKITKSEIEECRYLKLVIKETLRLHPAGVLLGPRESRERAEIEGYEIPKKTKVIINAWALGRDPEYWEDAEMFMPERFQDSGLDYKGTDFEYIPFGAGRRMCPGITFGVASVELPIAQLLYHFDWRLPDGITPETLDMTEAFALTVAPKSHLHLIPSLYSPEI